MTQDDRSPQSNLRRWIAVVSAAAGAAATILGYFQNSPLLAALGIIGIAYAVILFAIVNIVISSTDHSAGGFWDIVAKVFVVIVLASVVAAPVIVINNMVVEQPMIYIDASECQGSNFGPTAYGSLYSVKQNSESCEVTCKVTVKVEGHYDLYANFAAMERPGNTNRANAKLEGVRTFPMFEGITGSWETPSLILQQRSLRLTPGDHMLRFFTTVKAGDEKQQHFLPHIAGFEFKATQWTNSLWKNRADVAGRELNATP